MSKTQLEKVVTARYLDSQAVGGDSNRGAPILGAEATDQFLSNIWDSTVLGNEVRRIRMRADTVEVDRIAVGERLLRVATEAVDDHVNATAVFSKIALKTTKLRFDWELSTEAIEDNRQGETLEDTIANLFAVQIGNDMEDLAINGDSTVADALMAAFDGYRKIVHDHGNVITLTGGDSTDGATRSTFNKAIKALDRRYLQRRNNLRFYTGSNVLTDFSETLMQFDWAQRQQFEQGGPVGRVTPGTTAYQVSGIPVVEIPMLPENLNADGTALAADGAPQFGTIELTFPENRLWGIKREIQVYQEFKPKKDTTEWTLYTRVGAQVENPDAYVIVEGIQIQ